MGWEDPLEKEMATHFSILAWRIPWTEEPGGLQSIRVTKSQTRLNRLSMLHSFPQAEQKGLGESLIIHTTISFPCLGVSSFGDSR